MVSSISNALSGYAAATQRLNTAANNIANAFTSQTTDENGKVTGKAYVPQEVVQSSQASGGVSTSVRDLSPATISRTDADGTAQSPNVDIAEQLVGVNIASYNAKGNTSVIKAEERNFKSLLDIIS